MYKIDIVEVLQDWANMVPWAFEATSLPCVPASVQLQKPGDSNLEISSYPDRNLNVPRMRQFISQCVLGCFSRVQLFAPLYILASFVKDKVSIAAWIYLWAFHFVPLIYISVLVPGCQNNYSSQILYRIANHISFSERINFITIMRKKSEAPLPLNTVYSDLVSPPPLPSV